MKVDIELVGLMTKMSEADRDRMLGKMTVDELDKFSAICLEKFVSSTIFQEVSKRLIANVGI